MTELISFVVETFPVLQNLHTDDALKFVLGGLLVVLFVCWRWNTTSKVYHLPPGPTGLPIFGYLPFLGSEPFKGLHDLCKRYGSVFGLYMGRTYVIILGDYDSVKETFSKSTTTDRPEKVFDFIPDGVGFSSVNGEEWIEQRRYCVRSMRDLGLGISHWEELVQEEVRSFVELVSNEEGRPFDVCKLLTASVANNISSLLFNKRLPMNHQTIEFLNDSVISASGYAAQAGLRNFFPSLCDRLAVWGISQYSTYLRNIMEFHHFVRDQVEDHRRNKDGNAGDFADGYLEKIKDNEENNLGNTFNETNLNGNIQALFFGASDTTRTSINWLLLTVATYLDIQSEVQQELDAVLGTEGSIQWSERASLPYTYAVIMEGQRWKTIAPLNTARIATEDIKVGEYDIPKGTTIIANNWGLHNDAQYWEHPEVFDPKRFLSVDRKQVNLKIDSYVPFSFGKRNCPGETVAMMEILFYFVALMHRFRILPPEGEVPILEATLGLTYQAVPQKLRFLSREK